MELCTCTRWRLWLEAVGLGTAHTRGLTVIGLKMVALLHKSGTWTLFLLSRHACTHMIRSYQYTIDDGILKHSMIVSVMLFGVTYKCVQYMYLIFRLTEIQRDISETWLMDQTHG